MNRRAFLASLLATAVLDPERLLWVPGKKTIFIPKPAEVSAAELVELMQKAMERIPLYPPRQTWHWARGVTLTDWNSETGHRDPETQQLWLAAMQNS